MAEIKNSFLRSKMNKDLDDRLIPNGEYRDAQNISVGKSEADDIGALETVLGNSIETTFGLNNENLQIIGYYSIENLNSIIVFLTDYTDPYTNSEPTLAPSTADCYIYQYVNGSFTNLIQGSFLNFSTTDLITGVSVIESLLFWTDNRNQPRKLNINLVSNGTYYTEENHISVARYNPYQPINLLTKLNKVTTGVYPEQTVTGSPNNAYTGVVIINLDTSTPVLSTWFSSYPSGKIIVTRGGATIATDGVTAASVIGVANNSTQISFNTNVTVADVDTLTFTLPSTGDTLSFNNITGIEKGMSVVEYNNPGFEAADYFYVKSMFENNIILNTPVTGVPTGVVNGDTIYFLKTTMTGEDITFNFNGGSSSSWPGDPDYLESRFIRLSYRFEFDDGEYSLMAPFTQIAFIPKQKGYFLEEQEDSTYRSTIVEFMENGVQNIELLIPFPDTLNNVQPSNTASYKIKSLEILYKESDAVAVKIIDVINYDEPNADGDSWTSISNSNIYTYNYQSRKPFRTLPSAQITRVYDKVPVKALAQETSGNRVIYGNFLDKYTSPSFLQYIVGVGPKSTALNYDNWVQYPNHSVKQNRNYQVGFILADKFGRQSDVILSFIKTSSTVASDGTVYGGDTIYSAYNSLANQGIIRNWFGDSLKIDISSPITSILNTNNGTPGLYANTGTGYNTYNATLVNQPTINGNTYTFTLGSGQTEIPTVNSFLEGEFTDYVKVTNVNDSSAPDYIITTDGQASSIYLQQSPTNPNVKYKYSINPTGWYSYKIVVKQQEQDYYNVYLPGILNGYPQVTASNPIEFPSGETNKTANIVLINDNINKVPRDLSEVGPEQKQFRSSVQLFGRVENTMTTSVASNKQFFPGIETDTAVSIATTNDSNMDIDNLLAEGVANIYQIDTKPLIARLSTSIPIGVESTNATATNMTPFLAIYETEPVDSLLDIFWETETVGLISELNSSIISEYKGAVGWSTYNSNLFTEASVGNLLTGLSPVNQSGVNLINTSSSSITVINGAEQNVTSQFNISRTGTGTIADPHLYNFSKVGDNFVYNFNEAPRTYTISMVITNLAETPAVVSNTLEITVSLQNVQPIINGGVALPAITNVNQDFEGTLATITGENGAVNASLKLEELKWSITFGNSLGYFSINETSGVLSKAGTGSSTVGTYNLTIQVEDAYNGSNTALGSLSQTANQQITVDSSIIGTALQASGVTVFNGTCNINGQVSLDCGTVTYYNQTSSSPTVGDEIRTGPNGSSSPLALAGYYSYNCSSTGINNRNYFQISGNDGVIDVVSTC